ncbi:unnamed protein product [Schistosoma spindalis]|nr:unnamed protein product [Schistosoma spindale]
MRNTEKSENLWCFSFIQYLMNKYFNYKTMQSHEKYITLKHNNNSNNNSNDDNNNLQYRRQSLNETMEKSKNLLKKSTTMLFTNSNNNDHHNHNHNNDHHQMNINTILHYNPLATNKFSKTYKSIKNQLNSSHLWKCPHCLTEIQLINIQTTPDIIIKSNQYNKKIRTNPWINYSKLELNHSKFNIPMTSYSISSSLTDSGIYLCTDNSSRYDYITRSTTETEINKNNYFNIKKNDIPIIPISPDPPPSPAPKCTQCIINPECLDHTNLSYEVNKTQDLLMNSNKTYKGFCKSATLDLSNLITDTNQSINKPRRRLLTKRVRNQMRRSWLQTNTGSTLLPYLSPSIHSNPSSSSSSSSSSLCKSPSSKHKVTLSADEKSSSYKNNQTENINDKYDLLSKQSDTYDDIYNSTHITFNKNTNISNSQSIIDNEINQSMITSFIENMSPELFKSMNINNGLNFSTVYNNNNDNNNDRDEDNFYDDIQLENLRTNLKILSEAKNVINMQMRNLGQNYINYLKSKYLMNTVKDQ